MTDPLAALRPLTVACAMKGDYTEHEQRVDGVLRDNEITARYVAQTARARS